ncbi:MAG: tRNA epoxyqueuosine(34) reductase QueG [Nitrospirae bacterium]|nr:tRNA epoxyqueuosine(34) reductase QueG [Nitrospirota bacterium]
MSLSDAIKREALALGFEAVGIARVAPAFPEPSDLPPLTPHPLPLISLLSERLRAWLDRGYHATMAWLARAPARRADPSAVLPGCRSMVCVGTHYYTGHPPREHPGHGRIARYAWGQDYHHVVLPRLERLAERIRALAPGTHTRCYVDTGPIMEKAWAQEAGLGWIGKHSNLVSAQFGSWLLLGEVLTTLDLEPDEPGQDLCGSCTLCIKACPTAAIAEPYLVDAARCISYLTIERHHPGQDIDPEFLPMLGNRIFGCDDCLDICPYNAQAPVTQEPAFQPSALTQAPHLETLAGLSASDFEATFRRSPIRRAGYAGFLRNVRIALDNLARSNITSSS